MLNIKFIIFFLLINKHCLKIKLLKIAYLRSLSQDRKSIIINDLYNINIFEFLFEFAKICNLLTKSISL